MSPEPPPHLVQPQAPGSRRQQPRCLGREGRYDPGARREGASRGLSHVGWPLVGWYDINRSRALEPAPLEISLPRPQPPTCLNLSRHHAHPGICNTG